MQIANNLLDGVILARDGATATLSGNVTSAWPAMFVNPVADDLHPAPGRGGGDRSRRGACQCPD